MGRWPLQVRLVINILIFSIPILVLTYLMYSSETVNITFSEKEVLGAQLQRPYEELLKNLSRIRISSALGQDAAVIEKQLVEDLSNLKSIYEKVGSDLLFTSTELANRKRDLASIGSLQKFILEKKWDEAIESVKLSITHLGDTSNLILDPDLDSYYLMDVTLLALPQMQDRIFNIIKSVEQLYSNNKWTEEDRIQVALFASLLEQSDLNRILADAQTSLNEDKNFYEESESLQKNLPKSTESLTADSKSLIALLQKLSKGEKIEKADFIKTANLSLQQSYKAWSASIDELEILLQKRIQTLKTHRTNSIIYSGLALLLTILVSIYIGYTISSSIKIIINAIRNLKTAADSSSEFSNNLNTASNEVFSSITKQAAAVEQTAASIEEINSMIKLTAENSKEAASMAQKANESATIGEKEISAVLNSMKDIAESSNKIIQTLSVIDDIAFQTNLLALNASVEAARAGEQGKGFAVVADAVRSLAQKAAVSAKEINSLVKENFDMITSSRGRADLAAGHLNEIVGSIQKVSKLNEEVAIATSEQGTGLAEISKAIAEFETASYDNQKNMDSIAEVSGKSLEQAKSLSQIITDLEMEVTGRS